MRSTIESLWQPSQSISMGKMSNKHMMHRTEDIHRPESRPFLKDPKWPRDDIAASLRNFKENAVTTEVSSFIKMKLKEYFMTL